MKVCSRFNGDEFVNSMLCENQVTDLDELITFIGVHEKIYLFGDGKCGQGIFEFLRECDLHTKVSFLKSDKWNDFLEEYKPGRDGVILSLKAIYYREVLPMMWGNINVLDVFFLKERSKDIFINWSSKEYLKNHFWISLPIVRHCIINCSACCMFAPLCDHEFYTLDSIKNDLSRIKELDINLEHINITGGETFLNPEVLDIIEHVRTEFPNNKIEVYTTGVPLLAYEEEQFIRLKKSNIELEITEYEPTKGRLAYVYEMLDKYNIPYKLDFYEEKKIFFKKTIDFKKAVPKTEYINCQYYSFCYSVFVFNGVIYKCATSLSAKDINKQTNGELQVCEDDYLKIEDIHSAQQIYDFWKSRHSMCSYCPRVTEVITWKKSEGKIEEWMSDK